MNIQNKNILITGAGGLLGGRLSEYFDDAKKLYLHYHQQLKKSNDNILSGDLGDEDYIKRLSSQISPDIIINCAAMADVDKCEENQEESNRINVEALRYFTNYFPDVKIVHISTDYLFSGDYPAKPNDLPNPINIYGEHKAAGEQIVLNHSKNNLVIRTNTMFDNCDKRNFFKFVYENLKNSHPIKGINDQTSNPISALTAAKLIRQLIEKDACGIFHIGGSEFVSRYELARRIAVHFRFDEKLIETVGANAFQRKAKRPSVAGLNCEKTETFLGIKMPSLDDELNGISK